MVALGLEWRQLHGVLFGPHHVARVQLVVLRLRPAVAVSTPAIGDATQNGHGAERDVNQDERAAPPACRDGVSPPGSCV